MLEELGLLLGLLPQIITLYLALVAVFVLKKPKGYPEGDRQHRFAVLIPARNEAAVIGETVRLLLGQNYPRELYKVYIIPNNCRDETEKLAAEAGANILHCAAPVRCKGDVLQQALGQLMREEPEIEVFCVFDADNRVHRDYLWEMNKAFCAGARVAKGKILAQNPHDSWVAGCYDIYFRAINTFFNRPRAAGGLSAKLVGTGFAVHRSLLEDLGGWNTVSLTEDVEFGAQCARMGEQVYWVPAAISYDEQPRSFKVSMIQRRRWCSGIAECALLRGRGLLKSLFGRGGILAFDCLMLLLVPFARALGLLGMLLVLLGGGCGIKNLLMLPLSYLGGCVGAALILLLSQGLSSRRIPAILLFPIFTLSWLPLHVLAVFFRVRKWTEIRHGQQRQETCSEITK